MVANKASSNTTNASFLLSKNPFYLLKSSPTDSIEILTDKYEDLLYEGDNEQTLTKLYQMLCASISRLTYEVSWVLAIDNEQTLKYISDPSSSIDESWPTLTKINLLANQFSQQTSNELLNAWIENWQQLSKEETLALILKQREQSSFPSITLEQLSSALAQLQTQQINSLIYDMASLDNIYNWLFFQVNKDSDKPLVTGTILSDLVTCADSVSVSKLEHIKEQITNTLNQLFDAPNEERETLLEPLLEAVSQWSRYTKIMDLARKRRGLQDQSKTIELIAEITSLVSDKVYNNIENQALYCNNLTYAIKVLKPIKAKIVADGSSLFEDLNGIISRYGYERDTLIFTTEFADLNTIYTQVKEKAGEFLQHASHNNFKEKTDDTAQSSLASDFHQELVKTLEKTADHEKREIIFNSILLFIWTIDRSIIVYNVYGVIAYVEELRALTKTYPFDQGLEYDESINFLNHTEGLAIRGYMEPLFDANDADMLSTFFNRILPSIEENTDLAALIRELQPSIKEVQKSQSSAGITSILNFIIIVIMAISVLAQCTR